MLALIAAIPAVSSINFAMMFANTWFFELAPIYLEDGLPM
jgi:hypothetical protein